MDAGAASWLAYVRADICMTGKSIITDKVRTPMPGDTALLIGNVRSDFPSARIQKGPVLICGNKDMSEEGVGFGVPVLKFGHEAIFPGCKSITAMENESETVVRVDYDMNLAERMIIGSNKKIGSRAFYKIKEEFSRLHREHPGFRRIIIRASTSLRRTFNINDIFEEVATAGIVHVLYSIKSNSGLIRVRVDLSKIKKKGCTEFVIMNELGANYFGSYHDSNGTILTGNAIGTWDETFADEASFIDIKENIKFTLNKVKGSRMFRGRECVEDRLAWSGLAYVIPQDMENFAYSIKIGACK